jgi:uncharacterized metal-binding protein
VNRKHRSLKHKLMTGVVLMLGVITSARALSHDEVRGPVVKFIDFYIAAQRANAPKMTIWERVIYGLAIARTPKRAS